MFARFAPLALLVACASPPDPTPNRVTENVVLVTLDGLRWQELFGGADNALMNKEHGGVPDVRELRRPFWRGNARERRELLMPFFWRTIAVEGQVFGDPSRNSVARVTNGLNFSYPGYQEILAGYSDDRIDSNAKRPNPNVTVLEWLNDRDPWRDRVAAFTCWDVFPFIVNEERSGVPVHSAWQPLVEAANPDRLKLLNDLAAGLPHYWSGVSYDVFPFYGALEYLKVHQPRVLFLGFGETDDWAHARRYDLYLHAARNTDRFLEQLWTTLQSMPQYAGRTSMVITTDHGRGATGEDWTSHGKDVAGCERIWFAVMGPDTPSLGLRADVEVTQAQAAATVAWLLGESYHGAVERASAPLPGIVAPR